MTPSKRLLLLVKRGSYNQAISILKNSNLDRSLDTFGVALLRYCAKHGNAKILRYLIERGCNIDAQDSKGRTALMRALQGKHHEVIKSLLSSGASTTILDNENKSAVHMVCAEYDIPSEVRYSFLHKFRKECSSSEEAADKLIEAGCHLYQAIYSGDARIVECMLERGISTNSMIPRAKISALHIAALLENVESVRVLLKFGAGAEAQDLMGRTPLFYVYRCSREHNVEKLEILRMLIGSQLTDLTQVSPTLSRGNHEAIRHVLSHLDFTARDEKRCTVLHLLALNCNSGLVDELTVHSDEIRDVEPLNEAGLTPLHLAAINGNDEMLTFLLDRGADVNRVEARHNRTPLYYAYAMASSDRESQYDRCVEVLLQRDADPRFVCTGQLGQQLTVFGAPMESVCGRYDKMGPAIAKLALMEKIGMPIPEVTRSDMTKHGMYVRKYDRYRRMLGREIHGNVTLLKLLAGSETKLEKYAGNKVLALKLKRIGCQRKVRQSSSYYCDILTKRFSRATRKRRLTDAAAAGVCKTLGGRVDRTHVVVSRVSGYLNEADLRELCQL